MELLAGSDVVNALSLLRDASIAAGNVRGSLRSGVDALNAYREWAVRYARTLRSAFNAPTVDELILSPGYARLDRLDPRAYGPGLSDVVSLELDRAVGALDAAHDVVEQKRLTWSRGVLHSPRDVVVLDTNVLLRHGGRLEQINWHDPLKAWPHEPIMLGVPLVVIEELDKLKTATGKMDVDGAEVPAKERARAALKLIDQWFGSGDARGTIHAKTADSRLGDVGIQLIADDLRHERLSNNDAEIIARAIGLQPFTAKLALATGDRAMRFRSQQAGLLAFDPLIGRA